MAYVYLNPGYMNLWDPSGEDMVQVTSQRVGAIFGRSICKKSGNYSLKEIPDSMEYWAQFGMMPDTVNNPIGLGLVDAGNTTLIGCSLSYGTEKVNLYVYKFGNSAALEYGRPPEDLNINNTDEIASITIHAKAAPNEGDKGLLQVFVNGNLLYDSGPLSISVKKINRICMGSYGYVYWIAVASHDITQDVFCPMTVAKSDVNGFTEDNGTFTGTGTGNTLKQKLTWPDTLKNASIQAVITDFPTAYYGASDTISPVETFVDDGRAQKETGLFTDIAKANTGALMGPFLEKNPITGGVWKKEDFDNTLFGVKVK